MILIFKITAGFLKLDRTDEKLWHNDKVLKLYRHCRSVFVTWRVCYRVGITVDLESLDTSWIK